MYAYEKQAFVPIVFDTMIKFNEFHQKYSEGVSETTSSDLNYNLQYIKYGICDIKIPRKSWPELLINEILNPFYIF